MNIMISLNLSIAFIYETLHGIPHSAHSDIKYIQIQIYGKWRGAER